MAARLTRDEEMELRCRRFEQSPEGRIKALEDRLSKLEPDDRKQEQQRKIAERMLRAQWSRGVRSAPVDSWPRAEAAALLRELKEQETKTALCGPYGRFFNEGTD